jgi:hypothetical protein
VGTASIARPTSSGGGLAVEVSTRQAQGAILLSKRHHADWIVLSIPLIFILAYCAYFLSAFIIQNTFQGHHLCTVLEREAGFDSYHSTTWLRAWAPLELALLGAYTWAVASIWRFRKRRGGPGSGAS